MKTEFSLQAFDDLLQHAQIKERKAKLSVRNALQKWREARRKAIVLKETRRELIKK